MEPDVAGPGAPISRQLWAELEPLTTSEEVRAGVTLISSVAANDRLFFLEQGSLELQLPGGSSIRLQAPTLVGELSVLIEAPPEFDVIAREGCRVRALAHERIWGLMTSSPSTFRDLIKALFAVALTRSRGSFHRGSYVALVAHDGRKDELVAVVREHIDVLARCALLTTSNTGRRLEQELGLSVSRRVCSGPLGGDQEIGALAVQGFVKAMVFFPDPLCAQPHSADVSALIRICELLDIPLAINPASAHLLLGALTSEIDA